MALTANSKEPVYLLNLSCVSGFAPSKLTWTLFIPLSFISLATWYETREPLVTKETLLLYP